jgi:hypothetical protein
MISPVTLPDGQPETPEERHAAKKAAKEALAQPGAPTQPDSPDILPLPNDLAEWRPEDDD